MVRMLIASVLALAPWSTAHSFLWADDIRLSEQFFSGHAYKVDLRVQVHGRMSVPTEKQQPARIVTIEGASTLVYDEKVLPAEDRETDRVIRTYRTVEIRRTVAGIDQEAGIREAVRRMVVLRSPRGKAPFSPDGPLTWGEIDVVRTDIFTPQLVAGVLPDRVVRVGETWSLNREAVRELTDLEKLDAGEFRAKYIGKVRPRDRELARIDLSGTVKGVDDMGPGRHTIEGTAYFDPEAGILSYLSFKATHDLLDGKDQVVGRVEGRFVLQRTATRPPADLADAALVNIDLAPTPDNSQLLYDNTELGIRFLYPRRWRVAAVQGRQVTLDGPNGAGILLTVESTGSLPSVRQYLVETEGFLKEQKARVGTLSAPRRVTPGPRMLDRFGLDADIMDDAVRMEYAVVTQTEGGITVAARLPRRDAPALGSDLERILAQLAVTKTIPAK